MSDQLRLTEFNAARDVDFIERVKAALGLPLGATLTPERDAECAVEYSATPDQTRRRGVWRGR